MEHNAAVSKELAIAVSEDKLNTFLGKAVGDLGASVSAVLMLIGDELGLYTALAGHRLSAEELARKTGTTARYIREWLGNQAAGGYVEYDDASDMYYLNEEQELCLANPNGPVDLPGAYQIVQDLFYVRERAVENFRSGDGMEWGEHHRCLFYGTERFFRGGYNANLISSWLPALDGVVEKLAAGGRGADVGLWTRREHNPYGAGISEFAVRRHRLSRRVDRNRARAGRESRSRQREFRAGRRHVLPRR